MNKQQKGSFVVVILIVVVAVSILGAGGYYVYSRNNEKVADGGAQSTEQTSLDNSTTTELQEELITTTIDTVLNEGSSLKVTHPKSWKVTQGTMEQSGYFLRDTSITSEKGNVMRIYELDGLGGSCPQGENTDTFTLYKRITTSIPNVVFSQYTYSDTTSQSMLLLEDYNSEYIVQEVKDMQEGQTLTDMCKLYIYNVVALSDDGSSLFVSLKKGTGDNVPSMTYDDLVADTELFKAVQSLSR